MSTVGGAQHKVIDAANMTGTVTSKATNLRGIVDASYQVDWTGTPVGAFTVEVSNDYDPQRATGTWHDIVLDQPPDNPAGSAAGDVIDLSELPFLWVRLKYVHTSGAGTLNAWFGGKGR